jgi:hypothetical protein
VPHAVCAALLAAFVLRATAAVASLSRLGLIVAVVVVVVGVYFWRRQRVVVLSTSRIALVESGWPRRTLAVVSEPQRVAVACSATGMARNDEPELAVELVGERGKISVRLYGAARATQLASRLQKALSEIGVATDAEALQGCIRERALPDGRVELGWPDTTLRFSQDGFSLVIRGLFGASRAAARGPVRACVVSKLREHLPSAVDAKQWELELRGTGGTATNVGAGLTRHELQWLAERIGRA